MSTQPMYGSKLWSLAIPRTLCWLVSGGAGALSFHYLIYSSTMRLILAVIFDGHPNPGFWLLSYVLVMLEKLGYSYPIELHLLFLQEFWIP